MQLVAYGSQDIYLTGNPQITFFKIVYRRHTNFAIESVRQQFNGTANWGTKTTAKLNLVGDLIHTIDLRVQLPAVAAYSNEYFRWQNWIGHLLIDMVRFSINGSEIDRQYGHWLHIWNELTQTAGHQSGYSRLVGNAPKLVQATSGNMPSVILYIPLQFWFNRNPGLALPIIALNNPNVELEITFGQKSNCFWQSGTNRTPGDLADVSLWVDYIYLDEDERRRFAQASHEYLIEQLQFTGPEQITQLNQQIRLPFHHPVKEIIWTVQKDSVVNPSTMATYGGPQWFNYTDSIDYSFYSGTPTDPLGGGIGTGAYNTHNWFNSLPLQGSANGSVITNNPSGANTSALNFNDLFGNTSVADSRAWSIRLPVFDNGENPTELANITLNGHDRFEIREGLYFNKVQPLKHHTNCPAIGINVYSFALKPEEYQPSGTCNFTKIDIAALNLTVSSATLTASEAKLRVYAVNYNILKIMEGTANLAYLN